MLAGHLRVIRHILSGALASLGRSQRFKQHPRAAHRRTIALVHCLKVT